MWKFKKALLASVFLGCLIGTADVLSGTALGQYSEGEWYCPTPTVIVGGNICNASGCSDASQIPGEPVWVCAYGGEQCPPLTGCEQSGGSS